MDYGIGSRIKAVRETQGISQDALDRKIGFSHGYISKLEGGHVQNPRVNTLSRVANALGCSVTELTNDSYEDRLGQKSREQKGVAVKGEARATRSSILHESTSILNAIFDDITVIGRLDLQRLSALQSVVADVRSQVEQEHRHNTGSRFGTNNRKASAS